LQEAFASHIIHSFVRDDKQEVRRLLLLMLLPALLGEECGPRAPRARSIISLNIDRVLVPAR
jgi:hypothetical protein